MSDRYQAFTESPPGRFVADRLGLPKPAVLRRWEPGQPVLHGPALVGGAAGGRLLAAASEILGRVNAQVFASGAEHVRRDAGDRASGWSADSDGELRFAGLVFDASGIESSEELRTVYEFFHPVVRRLEANGRLIVLGTPPDGAGNPRAAAAQQALDGFVRSVGKEIRRGSAAQLIQVEPGAERNLESTLRFLLSARSAYVSGQTIRVGPGDSPAPADWERPLADRTALVTGASRGIGRAIAETLARDGAHVVCLDVPAQGADLTEVANAIGGSAVQLDITGDDAPQGLSEHLRDRHGGVDIVVHNAGVTRDKTLGRMDDQQWDMTIAINLTSQERINEALLAGDVLGQGARVVCVSSQSGIAGNAGQTNYAASKAGIIGMVRAMAPVFAERGATINAVAPGFIETQMTAAMPTVTREAGRRMNSMSQGGLPVDVAETIAWFASSASGGVNGQTVRVDGQSLIGA